MWIDVEGGRLFVETSGSGSPILTLHGWPLDHRLFEPQVEELGKLHRLITFDRRGFGISRAPPDVGMEVADVVRILEALSLAAVHVLGVSQGGRIALRFAISHPHRVRSLILQGAVIDGYEVDELDPQRIPLEEFASLARDGRMKEIRKRWLAHPMMALYDADDRARRLVQEMMNGYTGADLTRDPSGITPFTTDVLAELRTFPAPCLLLTGVHETAARKAHARKLLELMPDCREITMDGSGHLSNLSEPGIYNRHVAEFCARADARWPPQEPALLIE